MIFCSLFAQVVKTFRSANTESKIRKQPMCVSLILFDLFWKWKIKSFKHINIHLSHFLVRIIRVGFYREFHSNLVKRKREFAKLWFLCSFDLCCRLVVVFLLDLLYLFKVRLIENWLLICYDLLHGLLFVEYALWFVLYFFIIQIQKPFLKC